VTGDPAYLDAAQAAADALATGQLESGGWDYLIDFDPAQASAWYRRTDVGRISPAEAAKRKNTPTFDDDNTQSALRLLVAVVAASPSPGGEREEDAPAIAVDAQTMPPQQRWTPWPPAALATAAAGGLGLLLLAQLARRLGERVLGLGRQVEALIWAIGRRAGPVERR
jgi:hypothetical protein